MACISKVQANQIEPEEMALIIKLLSTANLAEGSNEKMLALVVKQLERLAGVDGKMGNKFRQDYAPIALAEAWEILYKNEKRDTYDNEDEEEEKAALSCSVVSFFDACSRIPGLRTHLRSKRMAESFPQILKWEEQLHSPSCDDIAIEQCWTGRELSSLVNCLTGQHALDRGKKVAFRVVCRIADILEGRTDGLRDRTVSLQDLAKREAGMWNPRDIEQSLQFLDNEEWEDRDEQAENFVKGDNTENVLRFLSSLEARELGEKQIEQLNEAEDMVKDFMRDGANMAKETVAKEEAKKQQDQPDKVVMDEVEIESHEMLTGRGTLMTAMHRCEDVADTETCTLFTNKTPLFEWSEEIFEDTTQGRMNGAHIFSAFLRILHALLIVPTKEKIGKDIAASLRRPRYLMKILTILEGLPCLACNVAAKFLHLMALVLDAGTLGGATSEDAPLHISILSRYIAKLSDGLLILMRLSRDKQLDIRETILCAEIARFGAAALRAAPYFRYTEHPESQKECVRRSIDWLVPPVILRAVVAMVLYDLQMDVSSSQGASQESLRKSMTSTSVKEHAVEFIGQLLLRTPAHKYDVLEAFNAADVFMKMSVRPSFMTHLLEEMNIGSYMLHCETLLDDWIDDDSEAEDRIVNFCMVENWNARTASMTLYLLCCTVKRIYLLSPTQQLPPYGSSAQTGGTWNPSWEVVFPRDPSVVWSMKYADISSIYRCYGHQTLVIDWKENKAWNPYDFFIFYRPRDCESVIYTLHRRSWHSAPIINCPSIRDVVFENLGTAQVLVSNIAVDMTEHSDLLNLRGALAKLFVLTTEKLMQFSLYPTNWKVPNDSDVLFDPDKHEVAGMQNERGTDEELSLSTSALHGESKKPRPLNPEATRLRNHMERLGALPPTRSTLKSSQVQAGPIAQLEGSWKMPPKEIHFLDNPTADLALVFGEGKKNIRFYSDATREVWRRAMAYYCSMSGMIIDREPAV